MIRINGQEAFKLENSKKKYIQPVNQASALTSNSAPISKKNDETFNVHATGMEHTESNIVV